MVSKRNPALKLSQPLHARVSETVIEATLPVSAICFALTVVVHFDLWRALQILHKAGNQMNGL
ncbi:hypothetical protein RHMOL_Rhmol03G0236500 [Rhododendron molle]|uniref:Uncharacterized protein n=1 Tax=Rhododendron molle TaxID=49168 RepID=A0ACC0PI49_RHOML|nr:hypothetical protein RHMOL_Rhmol03G0236500 [Rhododendron molle]